MITIGMRGTKWTIFTTAVTLFSQKGYNNVSMRNIADEVGIKAASIYNHFSSKDDILDNIYKFYDANYSKLLPNLDEIVASIGKVHPYDIFKNFIFVYEEDLKTLMYKCLLISHLEKEWDKRAESLIKKIFIDIPKKYYTALLLKMIDKKVIEPINIDAFLEIISNYDFATTARYYTSFAMSDEAWLSGRELIFSLIVVKKQLAEGA